MKKKSFFVLMFHGIVSSKPEHFMYPPNTNCFVRESDFEKVIRYCSKKYKILKLADLEQYFNGTATQDGVLISFDDGLQSLCHLGLPILEKHGATAVTFITSDWTNNEQEPAVFSLEYQLYQQLPATVNINCDGFSFTQAIHTKSEIPELFDALWMELFQKEINPLSLTHEQVSINGAALNTLKQEPGGGSWKTMPWNLLKKAVDENIIEIGAHGQTHTPFTWLSNEQLISESIKSKEEIFNKLQIVVNSCSFPNGFYNNNTLETLSKHFTYGFTNKMVKNTKGAVKINIARYNVPFQRPNNISSLVTYPLAGRVLRKLGSVTGLF